MSSWVCVHVSPFVFALSVVAMSSLQQRLQQTMNTLPAIDTLWLAYSGGVDSHVLLHLLNTLRPQLSVQTLRAIYINHQLHDAAAQWGEHCARTCDRLGVDFQQHTVSIALNDGKSLEAAARTARYAVFHSLMKPEDCLVTAHHQDDQAETLLLQLFRGAGPHGLAAMPLIIEDEGIRHLRPMLNFSRDEIVAYARLHNLHWIEDSSNSNPRFDRNFLRHEVIPLLKQRWPSLSRTVSRSAQLCAESGQLLDIQAQHTLGAFQKDASHALPVTALPVMPLLQLSDIECRNVLRVWLESLGLPLPSFVQMQNIMREVLHARQDAEPLVRWSGAEIRRYDERLYAMTPLPTHDARQIYHWDMATSMTINGVGRLLMAAVSTVESESLSATRLTAADVSIRFRQGGERCHLAGHAHSHSLKHLFQHWRIHPWLRDRVPLLFVDGELAAVAGYGICEGFQTARVRQSETDPTAVTGLKLIWQANASFTDAVIKSVPKLS